MNLFVRLFFACLSLALLGQAVLTTDAWAERRAFVVGISEYEIPALRLVHPADDAKAMSQKLTSLGFKVSYLPQESATIKKIFPAWKQFVKSLKRDDDVLVYFSGHGMSVKGASYLAVRDINPSDVSRYKPLTDQFMSLSHMVEDVAKTFPSATVWIIDACRDNKLNISDQQKGLKYAQAPANNATLYGASEGKASFDVLQADAKNEKHSVFTRGLLKVLENNKSTDIWETSGIVAKEVAKLAQPQIQVPEARLNMIRDWCFDKCSTNVQGVTFQNIARTVAAIDTVELSKSLPVVRSTIGHNAVFLGKRSALLACDDDSVGLHPFGCEVLKELDAGGSGVERRLLVAQTNVYRHRFAPEVKRERGSDGATRRRLAYSSGDCRLGSVIKGETVEVAAVLKYETEVKSKVAGHGAIKDISYWGLLPEKKACPTVQKQKNLVAKVTRLNAGG